MDIQLVAAAGPPVIAPPPGPTRPPAPPTGASAERATAAPEAVPAAAPSTEFEVHFDKASRMYLVRLVDPETKQVVVQVPPQQVLDLVSHLLELNEQKEGA